MGEEKIRHCDCCGKTAEAERDGFTFKLYGADIVLKVSQEPIWGTFGYPVSWKGELCEACRKAFVSVFEKALAMLLRERKQVDRTIDRSGLGRSRKEMRAEAREKAKVRR